MQSLLTANKANMRLRQLSQAFGISRSGLYSARHRLSDWSIANSNPSKANHAWVGEITDVRTASNWLDLAVVLNLFSCKVVGWACGPTHGINFGL